VRAVKISMLRTCFGYLAVISANTLFIVGMIVLCALYGPVRTESRMCWILSSFMEWATNTGKHRRASKQEAAQARGRRSQSQDA
jgi:hypothetical protein